MRRTFASSLTLLFIVGTIVTGCGANTGSGGESRDQTAGGNPDPNASSGIRTASLGHSLSYGGGIPAVQALSSAPNAVAVANEKRDSPSRAVATGKLDKETDKLLKKESRASFDFFWKETNATKGSPGYGLIADRAPGNPDLSSVASTGFGLSALPIGVENRWVSKGAARERALGTLDTLLRHAAGEHGFFYHFLNMDDGTRATGSELSIIDTAIAVNGALTAGAYFGGEVAEKADELYKRVEWPWFRDPSNNQFYMAYSPESGFAGHWDFYAEQLMLYLLSAGSPTHPADPGMFYDFIRDERAYGDGEPFFHSWFGSIFTYQYSHAWFDFRGYKDREGVDWWANSVKASEANRRFSADLADEYATYGENAWGMTASDSPNGYNGLFGAPPSGFDDTAHAVDGTLAPAGALGSIVFTPKASIEALKHFNGIPSLWGTYGLTDAYNLAVSPMWVDPDVIGIDKGIGLLMIENYKTGLVWDLYMSNRYVQEGARKIGLTKR